MSDIILKVRNTTVYKAVQVTSDEAERIVSGWLRPLVESDDQIDLSGIREHSLYALRHPKGAVTFVHPGDYLIDFEEVDGTLTDTSGEPTDLPQGDLSEESIAAFVATLNKNSEAQQPE